MYTEEKRESGVALTQKKQDDTLLNIGFLSYVENRWLILFSGNIDWTIYVMTMCTADERRWNMDSYEKRKFV